METQTQEVTTDTSTDELILQELQLANEKYDSIIEILGDMTDEEVETDVLESEANTEQTYDDFQQYIMDSQKATLTIGLCILLVLLITYGHDLSRTLFRKM